MLRQAIQIAKTEFSLRDQGTFLGFLWTLFNPVLLFITLYGVFGATNTNGTLNLDFALYLMAGILFWNFFSGSSIAGVSAISFRPQYLSTTTVPLTSLILGGIFTQYAITLIEAIICLGILILIDPAYAIKLPNFIIGIIWIFPLSLSITLLLLWARRYFLDTTRLWELALRVGFFLTPIFYYAQDKPFHHLLKWNPLFYSLQIARNGFASIDILSCGVLIFFSIIATVLLLLTEKNKSLLIEAL